MAEPAPAPAKGGAFSKKIAGLPGWQWAAILGLGGGAVYYLIHKNSATAASTSSGIDPATGLPYATEAAQGGGDNGSLQPIIDQLGASSTASPAQDALNKQLQAENRTQTHQLAVLQNELNHLPKPKPATGKAAQIAAPRPIVTPATKSTANVSKVASTVKK